MKLHIPLPFPNADRTNHMSLYLEVCLSLC